MKKIYFLSIILIISFNFASENNTQYIDFKDKIQARRTLQKLDKNKNGYISEDDFSENDKTWDKIKKFDKNNDGKINRHEIKHQYKRIERIKKQQ